MWGGESRDVRCEEGRAEICKRCGEGRTEIRGVGRGQSRDVRCEEGRAEM